MFNLKYFKKYSTIFFLFFSLFSFAQNRFSNDSLLRKIYNAEYERKIDSIIPFLTSQNNFYRYAAIQSISSIQDTSMAKKLIDLLALEKVDSLKMMLVNSLSQLDCYVAFYGLKNFYSMTSNQKLKMVCIAAIGKVSKHDVTVLFIESFNSLNKKDELFIGAWLKGVYLSQRRKNIDVNQSKIADYLNQILENYWGKPDEVNYYYSKIIDSPKAASPEIIKTPINNLKEIEAKLSILKTPYLQIDELEKYILSAIVCKEIIFSSYHSLLKYYVLDYYLKQHTWNQKIDQTFIQTIFDQMDVALISRMCEYIIAQNNNKLKVQVNLDVLQNIQRQLFLPRDFETWIDLEKAILSFEGKTYTYKSCFETGYQNPIDWKYVCKISTNQKVKVTTTRGELIMLLKVNEAPASVANFLKLVDVGYYNGKYFHRMVYNFVVQGGCPRGDGWGSLDWNQRSEVSSNLRYKKGSVGLASVGKDSEGVQFFISHNLAPHLEGKYTIFAELIKGFPVLDNLMVGDQILSIERL
jgi:cyclophilin family peptidyl-prolyl cis-trans isomerase